MHGVRLIISTLILIISNAAFSSNTDLKNSKAVVVTEDSKNVWWGKYISTKDNKIKVKLNPTNKNLNYIGFDSFTANLPRDKVFACAPVSSKKHICVADKDMNSFKIFRISLMCANGILTTSSGSYYFPEQYYLEVDQINEVRKGSKIIAQPGNNSILKSTVKYVFANNWVHLLNTTGLRWVYIDQIKLRK